MPTAAPPVPAPHSHPGRRADRTGETPTAGPEHAPTGLRRPGAGPRTPPSGLPSSWRAGRGLPHRRHHRPGRRARRHAAAAPTDPRGAPRRAAERHRRRGPARGRHPHLLGREAADRPHPTVHRTPGRAHPGAGSPGAGGRGGARAAGSRPSRTPTRHAVDTFDDDGNLVHRQVPPVTRKHIESLFTRIRRYLPWARERQLRPHDLRHTSARLVHRAADEQMARLHPAHDARSTTDHYLTEQLEAQVASRRSCSAGRPRSRPRPAGRGQPAVVVRRRPGRRFPAAPDLPFAGRCAEQAPADRLRWRGRASSEPVAGQAIAARNW